MTAERTAPPATSPVAPAGERASRWSYRADPMHVLVAVTVIAALFTLAGPLTDIDLFWHLLLGQEILDRGTTSDLGTSWSLNLTGTDWQTTQWLSEVVLAVVHDLAGWRGILALRMLLGLALVLLLARQLFARSTPRVAAPVLAVAALAVVSTVEERPMLATLLFTVWLAGVAVDLLGGRRAPSRWLVLGLVVLWANLHGGWVLAPAILLLVALGLLLDGRERRRDARSAAVLSAVALVAGCITPVGPAGALAPLRFDEATTLIVEWQRTVPWGAYGIGFGLLLAALALAWARGRTRPPASELLYVAAVTGFYLHSFRNVAPAVLLLAPVVAVRLQAAFDVRPAVTGPRERRLLTATVAALAAFCVVLVPAAVAAARPLEQAPALEIARTLADEPEPVRVLNAYNTAGVLAFLAAPNVRLAVDGRADRYGADFLDRYVEAQTLSGDWRAVLDEVDADVAVLGSDTALAAELRRLGWTLEQEDDPYVLLRAPAAPDDGGTKD